MQGVRNPRNADPVRFFTGPAPAPGVSCRANEQSDGRWLRFDPVSGTLHLTRLYDWYGSDFLQAAPSVEEYVAAHERAGGPGRRPEARGPLAPLRLVAQPPGVRRVT